MFRFNLSSDRHWALRILLICGFNVVANVLLLVIAHHPELRPLGRVIIPSTALAVMGAVILLRREPGGATTAHSTAPKSED